MPVFQLHILNDGTTMHLFNRWLTIKNFAYVFSIYSII